MKKFNNIKTKKIKLEENFRSSVYRDIKYLI